MKTISERLQRLGHLENSIEGRIVSDAIAELGRLQRENSQLREEGAALLDANHNLSAEIDILAGRLGKERADGMERLAEIDRLNAEIDRLRARTVPGWSEPGDFPEDPDGNLCGEFQHGIPAGNCYGDGHYLCEECTNRRVVTGGGGREKT